MECALASTAEDRLSSSAARSAGLLPREIAVCRALIEADRGGHSFQSYRWLAAKLGVCKRTIIRAVAGLVKKLGRKFRKRRVGPAADGSGIAWTLTHLWRVRELKAAICRLVPGPRQVSLPKPQSSTTVEATAASRQPCHDPVGGGSEEALRSGAKRNLMREGVWGPAASRWAEVVPIVILEGALGRCVLEQYEALEYNAYLRRADKKWRRAATARVAGRIARAFAALRAEMIGPPRYGSI